MKHGTLRPAAETAAATFNSLVISPAAYAAGSNMPWEQPLNQILQSVEGPVAKILAVIIIIVTGLTLAFGDTLVLYTDGVVEARRGGKQFGVDRLDALLAEHRLMPARAIATAALGACRRWADGGELKDDFAVVVIKRSEPQR